LSVLFKSSPPMAANCWCHDQIVMRNILKY
jgi:hypothetical protein